MAAIGVSFRWLDILEKEFDKAYVDLELLIGDMESEELELVYPARQKMATLSSCFAQLAHKAQTVFQNSAKIEAELVNLRAELVEARAARQSLEEELHVVLLQLHAAQLQQQGGGAHGGAQGGAQGMDILTRLQGELEHSSPRRARHQLRVGSEAREAGVAVEAERAQLERENAALRQSLLALQSEVSGARLAAKYLDKELAGRIQQLQLFGRDMKTDLRNKLWRQLEAEILLQRHKTVVRACRLNSQYQQQQRLNNINNNGQAALSTLSTLSTPGQGGYGPSGPGALSVPSGPDAVPIAVEQPIIRTVTIARQPGEGLGMSVTGGREHGVPILISELEADGPAARTNALYVGDAILAVNRVDLRQAGHKEAVALLSSHPGDVTLEVQFLASAEDSEDDNSLMGGDLENYRYRFFDEEVLAPGESIDLYPGYLNANGNDSGAVLPTPTAPRTPDSRNASEASFSASPVFSAAKMSTIAVEVPTSVSESEASPLHEQPVGGGGGGGTGGGEGDSEEAGPGRPGTRTGGVAGEDSDNSAVRGFSVASIQRILRTLTSASPATSPSPSVSPSASPSASPATSTPVSPERRLKTHPGFAAPALRTTREEPAVNSHASARVTPAPPRQTFQTLDNESFTRSGEDGTQEIYRFRKPISDESQSEKMSDSGIAVTASGGSASGSTSAYGGAVTYNHNKPKQTKKRSKRSARKGAGLGHPHPHPHTLSDGAVSSPDSLYFKGRFVPSDAVLMDSLGDPDFGTPV